MAAGAEVDAVNGFNESALSLAVTGLPVEIVAVLIETKVGTNAPCTGGSATPGLRTSGLGPNSDLHRHVGPLGVQLAHAFVGSGEPSSTQLPP